MCVCVDLWDLDRGRQIILDQIGFAYIALLFQTSLE